MSAQQTIRDAYERLEDAGVSPRDPLMLSLSQLMEATDDELPSGDLKLSATLAPGGLHVVTDQHGRRVAGVTSVAVFKGENGQHVFQVNL